MKKIIRGKMYDTETAKKIHEAAHGEGFRRYEEALYRKRSGEYFLAGEGGPATHYAHSTGLNLWSGGEKIIPLSYAEALEWGEREMDADEYQEAFGPVSEGELAHLHISLPADVADRIRKAAASEGISVSECVARRFS